MNEDIALQVKKLNKCFKIYENPWQRALEWGSLGKRAYHQPFWALQEISFEAKRGEFLGIIGRNGAGKSTLLKILSGVLEPTSGAYQVNGKILSMLELGADFNPYLTGRENIIRSAELWGFPDGYVQERMEQIIEFSELGDFFDRPVGMYSTGMSARLAFSLFAFLECDILILDEVLAVGDLFFRQKCYARLEELIARDTTIILVTHDMGSIRHYCDRVLLLDKGRKMYEGEAQEAISLFHRLRYDRADILPDTFSQADITEITPVPNDDMFWPADDVLTSMAHVHSEQACLTKFALCNQRGEPCVDFEQGDWGHICCEFQVFQDIGVPVIGIRISNQFNVVIYAKGSLHFDTPLPMPMKQGSVIRSTQTIALNIQPAEYVVGVSLHTLYPEDYARLDELAKDTEFWQQRFFLLFRHQQVGYFKVHPRTSGHTHWGVCDLPGEHGIQVVSEHSD